MTELELKHYGILGQKWGVRRYQNKDGTLTTEGKTRQNSSSATSDSSSSSASKKATGKIAGLAVGAAATAGTVALALKNSSKTSDSSDSSSSSKKNSTEDTQKVLSSVAKNVSQITTLNKKSDEQVEYKKMDLSNMTDQEMRDQINRSNLESQYTKMFGEVANQETLDAQKYVNTIMDGLGASLTVASSALAIALAIQKLKGG